MNKNEFHERMEEGAALIERKNYSGAVALFDELNLDSVRDPRILQSIAKAYEMCRRYEDAQDLLLQAHDYAPRSRGTLFHLCTVAVKAGNLKAAKQYYRDFTELAKGDSERFILEYRIAQAEGREDAELIRILENYKAEEPDDRWMYELAKLYTTNNRPNDALMVCNEIGVWFFSGKYVQLARELRAYLTGEALENEEPEAEGAEDGEEAAGEENPEDAVSEEENAEEAPKKAEIKDIELIYAEEPEIPEETPLQDGSFGAEDENLWEETAEAQEETQVAGETEETQDAGETEEAQGEPQAADEAEEAQGEPQAAGETEEAEDAETAEDEEKTTAETAEETAVIEVVPENTDAEVRVEESGADEMAQVAYEAAEAAHDEDRAETIKASSMMRSIEEALQGSAAEQEDAAMNEELKQSDDWAELARRMAEEKESDESAEISQHGIFSARDILEIREIDEEEKLPEGEISLEEAIRNAEEPSTWQEEAAALKAAAQGAEAPAGEEETAISVEETEAETPAEEETAISVEETEMETPAEEEAAISVEETETETTAEEETEISPAAGEEAKDWVRVDLNETPEEHVVFTVTGPVLKREGDVFFDTKAIQDSIRMNTREDQAEKKVVFTTVQETPATEVKEEQPEETEEAEEAVLTRPSEEMDELGDLEAALEKKQMSSERLGNLPIEPEVDAKIRHFVVFGEKEEDTLERAQELLKEISGKIQNPPKRMLKTSAVRIAGADIVKSADAFNGCMVVIEQAGMLSDKQLFDFSKLLSRENASFIIAFTDTDRNLAALFERVPEIAKSFSAAFEGRTLTARDLVDTAKEYLYYQKALMSEEAEGVAYEYAREMLSKGKGFYRSEMRDYAARALSYADKKSVFGLFGNTAVDDDGFLHIADKHFIKAGE